MLLLPIGQSFLPTINNDHWTIFCFNFNHKRIDILDSLGHDRDEKALKAMKDRVVRPIFFLFVFFCPFSGFVFSSLVSMVFPLFSVGSNIL